MFLRFDALPARDGGGVVFPRGFRAPGFRLEEWEFVRYVARDQNRLPEPERWQDWRRVFYWIAGFSIVAAVSLSFHWVTESGLVSANALCTLLLLLMIGWVAFGWIDGFHFYPRRFLEAYPRARRLSYFAVWPHRVMAATASDGKKWQQNYVGMPVLYAGVLLYWIHKFYRDGDVGAVALALAAALFGYKVAGAAIVAATWWAIRRRLGRPPTKADIEPVSVSDS